MVYKGGGEVASTRHFRLTGKTYRWYLRLEGGEHMELDLWFRPEDKYKHQGLANLRAFNKVKILKVEELPD